MTLTKLLFMLSMLAGITNAFDGLVRNFKVASQNATHATFSWDMQSGYHDTSNINYFWIYYRYAFPGYSPYGTSSYYVSVSDTTQVNGGYTFLYITSVTTFNNYAQYIMSLYVNHDISPYNLYSDQIYVEIGVRAGIEMKIKLQDEQTCFDFTSITSAGTVGNEVYRALRIYCQCTYEFINAIRIRTGYFDCSPTGYVTYRAYMTSTDATKRPSTLVGALNNWLQDTNNNTIIAGGRKYTVEPGACGVTVPYTNAPFCLVTKAVQNNTTPSQTAQSSTVNSSQTAAAPVDNTAVIVASVFAAMFFILGLGLVAYILAIKKPLRKTTNPAAEPVGSSANNYIAPGDVNTIAARRPPHKRSIDSELEPYEPMRI